jgi:hypothetical protein
MSEIKLYLNNKTKAVLEFSIGDETSITIPAHSSRIVSTQSGITLFVSSEGLVGDMWIYEINEDLSLDCSLVGDELQLRVGSPIR